MGLHIPVIYNPVLFRAIEISENERLVSITRQSQPANALQSKFFHSTNELRQNAISTFTRDNSSSFIKASQTLKRLLVICGQVDLCMHPFETENIMLSIHYNISGTCQILSRKLFSVVLYLCQITNLINVIGSENRDDSYSSNLSAQEKRLQSALCTCY